jgi:2-polyprenyl-3-methyl-5-hydroxy-6-metoxy-1,4-benzoquinol methylase
MQQAEGERRDPGSAPGTSVSSYYEYARPEIARLVPPGTRHVLELGCAAGACGAAIKALRGCRVTGVELVPEVAARAAGRLDRVIVGDCEALDLPALLGGERFDCLVAADVLEHLRDPLAVLLRLHAVLAPDAALVASFPNVRHYSVLANLVNGHWTYTDAGILDRTHLRFFTRREFARLLSQAGFADLIFYPVNLGPYEEWQAAGCPQMVSFGPLTIQGLPVEEIADLFAYQYLVVGRLAAA